MRAEKVGRARRKGGLRGRRNRLAVRTTAVVLSCTGWISAASVQEVDQGEQAAPSGQSYDVKSLVDYDYAFELRAPAGWVVLGEDQAQPIVEDACAGMASETVPMLMMVLMDPMIDLSLEEYVDLIMGTGVEVDVLGREPVEIDGLPALRLEYRSDSETHAFHAFVTRGEYYCQLVVECSEGARVAESDWQAAMSAVHWRDGAIRHRTRARADTYGVGWLLEGGRFTSVAHEFEISAPDDFHFVVGNELNEVDPEAEIGFLREVPLTGVTLSVQPARGEDASEILAGAQLDASVSDNLRWTVLGTLRDVSVAPGEGEIEVFEYVSSSWLLDEKCYWVVGWYRKADAVQGRSDIASALASLRLLTEPEAAAVRADLDSRVDPDFGMTDTQALRRGIFVDYDRGVSWRKPKSGMWRVLVGEALVAKGEGSSALYFEEPRAGIFGRLVFDEDASVASHDEYHEYTAGWYAQELYLANRGTPSRRKVGDTELLVTTLDPVQDPMGYRYIVGTAWTERVGIDLVLWGLGSNLSWVGTGVSSADLIEDCLQSLRVHAEPLPMVLDRAGRYTDRRFGFALELPDGWSWRSEQRFGTYATSISGFADEERRISVLAVQPSLQLEGATAMRDDLTALHTADAQEVIAPRSMWRAGRLLGMESRVAPLRRFWLTVGELYSITDGAGTVFRITIPGRRKKRSEALALFELVPDPLGE